MDELRKLQLVELDLFKCFAEICEKLNLRYFLVCGSAIGAARHGGFIPWDDDLDVGMYREDYYKFLELAPALLPDGLFLQNYKSDPQFPYMFAKLRNSNTTYIEKSIAHLDINHGIYMDIFPLDGYPESSYEQKRFALKKRYYQTLLASVFQIPNATIKGKVLRTVLRFLGYHKRSAKIVKKYEALISKYSIKTSSIVCNHGTWHGTDDYIPKEMYGNGTSLAFEGRQACVPERYDDYLTHLFGEWRQFPSPEKQKGHHYYEICDTEKPYTYYTKQGKK